MSHMRIWMISVQKENKLSKNWVSQRTFENLPKFGSQFRPGWLTLVLNLSLTIKRIFSIRVPIVTLLLLWITRKKTIHWFLKKHIHVTILLIFHFLTIYLILIISLGAIKSLSLYIFQKKCLKLWQWILRLARPQSVTYKLNRQLLVHKN